MKCVICFELRHDVWMCIVVCMAKQCQLSSNLTEFSKTIAMITLIQNGHIVLNIGSNHMIKRLSGSQEGVLHLSLQALSAIPTPWSVTSTMCSKTIVKQRFLSSLYNTEFDCFFFSCLIDTLDSGSCCPSFVWHLRWFIGLLRLLGRATTITCWSHDCFSPNQKTKQKYSIWALKLRKIAYKKKQILYFLKNILFKKQKLYEAYKGNSGLLLSLVRIPILMLWRKRLRERESQSFAN